MKHPFAAAVAAILIALVIAASGRAASIDITQKTPANGTTWIYNYTNLSYTPVSTLTINSCTLYINSSIYAYNTASSIANNTENFFYNVQLTSNGTYYWYVSCADNKSNTQSTGQNYFILSIDKTPPTIVLDISSNSSINKSGTGTFKYTVTDLESGPQSCKLIVDNQVKTTNTPNNGTASTFSIPISAGTYIWSVNCTDKNGNEATSSPALIGLAEPGTPSVIVTSPTNNTVDSTGMISFQYTPSSDENISFCKLLINGNINTTVLNPQVGVLNSFSNVAIADGSYTWAVNCTSQSGKESGSGILNLNITKFALLSNFLVVKAVSPPDNYVDVTGAPTFKYNVSSVSDIKSCQLIANNSVRDYSKNIATNAIISFDNIGMSDGIWTWRVECTNVKKLIASTEARRIVVSRAISVGPPVAATDVNIPGLGTRFDISQLNVSIAPAKGGLSKQVLLAIITISAVLVSSFVFIVSQPLYVRKAKRMLGIGKVMQMEQLKFYIDQQLRRGISEERIRRQLRKYNWNEEDIDAAFQDVYAEIAEELKVKKTRAGK